MDTTLSDEQFEAVSKLAFRIAGIQLGPQKRELVRARIQRRMRAVGAKDVGSYLAGIRGKDTTELSHFVDALTTNKTSFFRENEHFEFFSKSIVPKLAQSSRVRIWCAASSTGEEPYCIAMSLLEGGVRGGKLLASDLSMDVLRTAAKGEYPAERAADVPTTLRRRYFGAESGGMVTVAPEVRKVVSFARINLMADWPIKGPLDAIWCRNCMIYFDNPTRTRLVNRFHQFLAPGGLLFIGLGESLTGIASPFKYVRPGIYAR